MALADLEGDGKVDVESQGQVEGHEDERVYCGADVFAQDTVACRVQWRLHQTRHATLRHSAAWWTCLSRLSFQT